MQQSVASNWPVIKNLGIEIRSLAVFCKLSGLIEKVVVDGSLTDLDGYS